MKGILINILLVVAIMAVAGAAGLFAAGVLQRKSSEGETEEVTQADLNKPEQKPAKEDPKNALEYYELDVPAVNLREERLARFLKTTLSLAVKQENFDDFTKLVEKKTPLILNWLVVNLSDRTVEECTGARNRNRLRRQILEALNELLDDRNLVEDVLFQEFAVH